MLVEDILGENPVLPKLDPSLPGPDDRPPDDYYMPKDPMDLINSIYNEVRHRGRSVRRPGTSGNYLYNQPEGGWIPTRTTENIRSANVRSKLLNQSQPMPADQAFGEAIGGLLGDEGPVVSLLRMLGLDKAATKTSQIPGKYQDRLNAQTPENKERYEEFMRLINQGKVVPPELINEDALPFTPIVTDMGLITDKEGLANWNEIIKQQFMEEKKYQQWLDDQVGELDEEEPPEEPYYPYIGYGGGWGWGGGGGGGGTSKKWVDWFKNLYWNI